MLDYARQRAISALRIPRRAVFVTSGPAGVQASEFPCEALGLDLYLLVPGTSDHLFNLEQDPQVTLLTAGWELHGEAQVIPPGETGLELGLLLEPESKWCVLLRVIPYQVHIHIKGEWRHLETFDFENI